MCLVNIWWLSSVRFKYKLSYKKGVSNGTGQCNFLGQRDRSSFIVPGQRTTGQAKTLAKRRDGPGQPKSRTGRKTKRDRAEKDILKQKKDALKSRRKF